MVSMIKKIDPFDFAQGKFNIEIWLDIYYT